MLIYKANIFVFFILFTSILTMGKNCGRTHEDNWKTIYAACGIKSVKCVLLQACLETVFRDSVFEGYHRNVTEYPSGICLTCK